MPCSKSESHANIPNFTEQPDIKTDLVFMKGFLFYDNCSVGEFTM